MLRPSFRLTSRPLCPSTFIFRWIGPWMDVGSLLQISAPLGRRMLTSLTCLLKKLNDGRGTPYPPPLGCFARHSAILIGHQHTVPSLLVVGSSIPSFLVVGCSIRASFTCLFKKNLERREGDTTSHTLPSSVLRPSFRPTSRPLCDPRAPFFPLDPPLDGCGLTTGPLPHISKQICAHG